MDDKLRTLSRNNSEIKSLMKIIQYTYEYSVENSCFCPDITLIIKIILDNLKENEDNIDEMFYNNYLQNQKN